MVPEWVWERRREAEEERRQQCVRQRAWVRACPPIRRKKRCLQCLLPTIPCLEGQPPPLAGLVPRVQEAAVPRVQLSPLLVAELQLAPQEEGEEAVLSRQCLQTIRRPCAPSPAVPPSLESVRQRVPPPRPVSRTPHKEKVSHEIELMSTPPPHWWEEKADSPALALSPTVLPLRLVGRAGAPMELKLHVPGRHAGLRRIQAPPSPPLLQHFPAAETLRWRWSRWAPWIRCQCPA